MERVQEELSRAHRELREATREIARAHREVARSAGERMVVREFNLGERAVIGVVPGKETPEGVEIIGVSPDGPAERAGLQAGDVLVSIRGEELGGAEGKAGRETLFRVIEEAEPGEALAVVVKRAGETWKFEVTPEQREPASWQSLIRIPEAPPVPSAHPAPALSYPSSTYSATGCIPNGSGGCYDWTALSRPRDDLTTVNLDLQQQVDIYEAMFNAISPRPCVTGLVSRGYFAPAMLQDKAASIHGKPAADLLWYWFPRLLGNIK